MLAHPLRLAMTQMKGLTIMGKKTTESEQSTAFDSPEEVVLQRDSEYFDDYFSPTEMPGCYEHTLPLGIVHPLTEPGHNILRIYYRGKWLTFEKVLDEADKEDLRDLKKRFPGGQLARAKRHEEMARRIESQGGTETKEEGAAEASTTLEDLIAGGEGEGLEFKSSLRWDLEKESVNRALEDVTAKTVAAFLNGQGGTLLIGVSNDGEVLGLKGDYHTLRKEGRDDQDRFALHLNNVLDDRIGKALVALNVRVSFPEADGTEICRVDVQKAAKPVVISLKGKDGQSAEKFYVRSGRSSQELSKDDKRDYISLRFSE